MRLSGDHCRWRGLAFPILHSTTLGNGHDKWQYLGGTFSCYTQSDDLLWEFGTFADKAADGDLYLPYVGAPWSINTKDVDVATDLAWFGFNVSRHLDGLWWLEFQAGVGGIERLNSQPYHLALDRHK